MHPLCIKQINMIIIILPIDIRIAWSKFSNLFYWIVIHQPCQIFILLPHLLSPSYRSVFSLFPSLTNYSPSHSLHGIPRTVITPHSSVANGGRISHHARLWGLRVTLPSLHLLLAELLLSLGHPVSLPLILEPVANLGNRQP